ncbi:chromosome segregation protein SMC [Desulforamulus aquiferis]|uniref:Chromosome partition protein Smc n=1 Tax=Desulforamulus aquiferis TaxID=1397668 RepID=A0AAW7ZD49_9FIRM|nr:chromosome segregation protein SMC [Desulforamulus aquiferis]MDO7787180.1 chromosome segregation protein SMC [Desulforamulus aquiferis]
MCLKRLDIQGFKSFGDRLSLELNPGLTVVVGPNGSGKSNISDAISWCLGEQRPTTLRGSRMEDIIFAGSDKRKPVGLAEVSLVLDNTSQIFSLPFNEVSISRRLYRSGESEYFINKTPCRLKDIQALFMDTGLGRGAYSIIGQGKVDEILNSRPEERRSVIEEAAGIVKYRHRKEEAARKLSSAQQDLDRISDLIDELAARIEPLELEAQRAKRYNQLSQEYNGLELALFKRDWQDLNQRQQEIVNELEQAKLALDNQKPEIEAKLNETKVKLQSIDDSLSRIREQGFILDSNLETIQAKIDLLSQQINDSEKEKERVAQEVAASHESRSRLLEELNGEKDKLNKLKEEILTQSKESQEKKLKQLEGDIKEKQIALDNYNSDVIEQLNYVAQQKSLRNQALDRKEQLNQRMNHLDRVSGEAKELEESLQNEISLARDLVSEVNSEKDDLITQEGQINTRLENINREVLAIQETLLSTKEEMVAKHSRLKVLEESLSSHTGFMRPVRELLKASKNHRELRGICGAVADLIKVPEGMETALEAALGGSLQNLVTETSAQAKEAIAYLKKNNLGRVTFMPLDSLKPTMPGDLERQALKLPGVIGLAAGLIESDEKYRRVVELLLGRLVVVDNLDHAIEVAKKTQQRLRLVTLSGELFHPGGSLSGGGLNKSTGGMLHTRREKDGLVRVVQDLQGKVQRATADYAEKQGMQQALEKELQAIRQGSVDLGLKLQAAEMELQKSEEGLNRAKERNNENLWESENIKQEILHWSSVEKAAAEKLAELELELEALQTNFAATQSSLAAARAEREELEKAVNLVKVLQAETRQQIIGTDKIVNRLEQEFQAKELFINNSGEALEQIQIRIIELESKREQLTRELKELKSSRAQIANELVLEEEERKTIAEQVLNFEQKLNIIQEEWQRRAQAVHSLELQLARVQTELNILTSRFEELGILDPHELDIEPVSNKRQAKGNLAELKRLIEEMGPVNARAESEYQEVTERYNFLQGQRKDLEESKLTLEGLIRELDKLMASQFEEAFERVNNNFTRVFCQLFGGGDASMALTEGNSLTCGIEITARPPGKKSQSLSLLSGGERALTAIALLFALLQFKPSPFCVLDEIEASLDDANVKRFADYLSRASEDVQFIVISHRKGTMEKAQYLYGVTMDEAGVTRLLSMSLEDNKGTRRLA